MDRETLQVDLEEQLNCSMCFETYSDPRLLQCYHIFCQQCLDRLSVRNMGKLTIVCPTCRHVTTVQNEVASLPAAFHVNQLLDILDKHKRKAAVSTSQLYTCGEHDTKEVDLYCETCGELICWKCIKRDGKHHNHDYEELDEAFEKCKEGVAKAVEPIKKHLPVVEKAQTHLEQQKKEISSQQAVIEGEINKSIDQLQQVLESRRVELSSKLQHKVQVKLSALTAQTDQVKKIHAQSIGFLEFMKKSQQRSCLKEVLHKKASVLGEVKKFASDLQSGCLKNNAGGDLRFSSLLSLLVSQCRNYGEVEVQAETERHIHPASNADDEPVRAQSSSGQPVSPVSGSGLSLSQAISPCTGPPPPQTVSPSSGSAELPPPQAMPLSSSSAVLSPLQTMPSSSQQSPETVSSLLSDSEESSPETVSPSLSGSGQPSPQRIPAPPAFGLNFTSAPVIGGLSPIRAMPSPCSNFSKPPVLSSPPPPPPASSVNFYTPPAIEELFSLPPPPASRYRPPAIEEQFSPPGSGSNFSKPPAIGKLSSPPPPLDSNLFKLPASQGPPPSRTSGSNLVWRQERRGPPSPASSSNLVWRQERRGPPSPLAMALPYSPPPAVLTRKRPSSGESRRQGYGKSQKF